MGIISIQYKPKFTCNHPSFINKLNGRYLRILIMGAILTGNSSGSYYSLASKMDVNAIVCRFNPYDTCHS